MGISSGKYRFTRSSESVAGFLSQNRASTDAIGALEKWQRMEKKRRYDIESDEDDELIAMLTFESSDEVAGCHIDALCIEYGLDRQFIR